MKRLLVLLALLAVVFTAYIFIGGQPKEKLASIGAEMSKQLNQIGLNKVVCLFDNDNIKEARTALAEENYSLVEEKLNAAVADNKADKADKLLLKYVSEYNASKVLFDNGHYDEALSGLSGVESVWKYDDAEFVKCYNYLTESCDTEKQLEEESKKKAEAAQKWLDFTKRQQNEYDVQIKACLTNKDFDGARRIIETAENDARESMGDQNQALDMVINSYENQKKIVSDLESYAKNHDGMYADEYANKIKQDYIDKGYIPIK